MDITCAIKGLAYQYLNAQSILFGRDMGIAADIVHVVTDAENLDLGTLTGLVDSIENHVEPFSYEGQSNDNWQDDPGLDIHRLSAQFTIIEPRE
jgi:hypothetical protein